MDCNCNPSTREAQAGGLWVGRRPGLYQDTLSKSNILGLKTSQLRAHPALPLEFGSQHPAGGLTPSCNSSSTPGDLPLPPSFRRQSPERQNLIGPASVSYYLLIQSTVTSQPQESNVRDRDLSRRFLKKVTSPL